MNASLIWLLVGAVLIAAEAFGIPGIGLLFGGLAALVTAVFIETGVVGDASYGAQIGWWFALTVFWALVLWKPLKNFRLNHNKPAEEYNNMVGDFAYIVNAPLYKGSTGEAGWSGTTMHAEIAPHVDIASIEAGSKVRIVDIKGATLIVVPAE